MEPQDMRDQVWQWTARGLNGLLDLWEQWIDKDGPPLQGDAVDEVRRFLDRAQAFGEQLADHTEGG